MGRNKYQLKLIRFISLFLLVSFFLTISTARVSATEGPSLYFSPSTMSGLVGEEVTVSIFINTAGKNVDGVTANFTYPSNILRVIDVSTPISTFTNTAEENMSIPGVGKLSRFLVGEYYNGTGEVASIKFRFIAPGSASLQFSDDAMVTFSGSDILSETSEASVLGAETESEGSASTNIEIPVQNIESSFFDPTTWGLFEVLVISFIIFGLSVLSYTIYQRREEAKE